MNTSHIEQDLMSYDEYNQTEHPTPYSFSIHKGTQFLYYFGANHSHDENNEQYRLLRKFWRDFLDKTNGKNSIVFVEGGARQVRQSESDAIARGAEADYITYLASKEDIPTFSPEPPEQFRFEELSKKFSREDIVYYQFARMAFQWNRLPLENRPTFHEYVGGSLKYDQTNSGWNDFDFSVDHMIKYEESTFNRKFNENDKQFYYDVINPTTTFSKINAISRFEDSGFRDAYILRNIEKTWNIGKNLFIVYGCSHVVMQEKAVRKLVE